MACGNIMAHKNPIDIAASALNSIAAIVPLSLPDLSKSDSLLQNAEKLAKRIGGIYNNKDELLEQSKVELSSLKQDIEKIQGGYEEEVSTMK
eukprot:9468127-Ditylum_brightwellii.AAC.1